MPAIPVANRLNQRDTSLTTFTIKVEGEAIPATYNVLSIDIYQAINQISFARLILHDGNAANQDFEIAAGPTFEQGKKLEIYTGYNVQESLLYAGLITKQRIKIKSSGNSLLYIDIRDIAHKMTLDRKSRYYKEISDGELFSQIGQEYEINVTSQLAGETHEEIVQYQTTDWDFIVARVERLGYYCIYRNEELQVNKVVPSPDTALEVTFGIDVYDADLEMDARTQIGTVATSAWDYTNQDLLTADIDNVESPDHGEPDGPTLAEASGIDRFDLKHSGNLKQQDLDAWAEAQMIKSRFSKIRGTVKIQGTGDVKIGDSILLKGFGKRFNGNAFVAGIRHALHDGNWTTTFQVGDSCEWHLEKYQVSNLPGTGFNPAIDGLHIGIVTQLQDDPNSENRILVRIPIINNEAQGTWCRIALPDAGESRGICWLPEIGDEVVVGFLNDDPNHAIILGSLHSSAKPSPLTASDDNHVKGIVSRGDMRITFDDEKNILSVETPKGNKIILDEDAGAITAEDENGSKLTMNSDGIELNSSKDIILKATGDIKIEGINIENTASAGFEATGNASSKLSSSGTTDVKGSIVNIN